MEKYRVWVHFRSGLDYWTSFKGRLSAEAYQRRMERQAEVSFVRIRIQSDKFKEVVR